MSVSSNSFGMERDQFSKVIQGGGSGEGFQEPLHLSQCTAKKNEEICRDIQEVTKNLIFVHQSFVHKDKNDEEIWTKAPNQSIKSLCPSGYSETTSDATHDQISATVEISANTMQFEIPKLPKSIETAIQIWRYGNSSEGYRAVHLFATADKRRCLIPSYKDKLWKESGNKRKYERILFFAKRVAEYNEKIVDIFRVGLDSEWKSAIHSFKAKWKVSDGTKLTPLEKKIKESS